MPHTRFPHVLVRALARLVPPGLHTRRLAAESRVMHLSETQREQLALNLRRMLHPKTA